ncbi:hypothetical protein DM77_2479 [Burkholderia mallei]|nr:hypothetical protein DM77_2479 [Burkholderia mallei]
MPGRHDIGVSAPHRGACPAHPVSTARVAGLLQSGKYCHAKNATSMLVHHFFYIPLRIAN